MVCKGVNMKKFYNDLEWKLIETFEAINENRQDKKEEIPGWIRVLYFVGFVFCFYVFLQTL